jgi:hypothetical protein
MGILPMFAVRRDIDRYADRYSPSEAILFFAAGRRSLRSCFLAGIPANAAAYRGHGQGCPCHWKSDA